MKLNSSRLYVKGTSSSKIQLNSCKRLIKLFEFGLETAVASQNFIYFRDTKMGPASL